MEKIIPFPDRTAIEAEACAWIARLDGDQPSSEDLSAFREWLGRSPQHREEIKRLTMLWADLNVLTELAVPLEKPRSSLWRRAAGFLKFGFPASRLAALASAAIIAAAIIFFYPKPSAFQETRLVYSTAVGERKPVTLSDGSAIVLNTDSQVMVSYSNEQRQIRLLKGEAYFKVAHNPNRPFLVYAGAGIVRAIGTAFSVHLKSRDIEVRVTEGTVELASIPGGNEKSPGKIHLQKILSPTTLAKVTANQTATFNQNIETIEPIAAEELERKLSWKRGMLVFSGERLQEVVDEVSRYTSLKIVILDPGLQDLRIGGYFRVGETDAMFEALETRFDVHVERVGGNVVQLSSGKS